MLPPDRKRNTRARSRRGGAGLLLDCTQVRETRTRSGPQSNLAVELRDFGWGGLQFVSKEPLRPPCPVSVQIKDPKTYDLFRARGDVRWCDTRKLATGEIHVVGVQFDEIHTPTGRWSSFFQPAEAPDPAPAPSYDGSPRRRGERYRVDDYFVSLCREGRFGAAGKPVNLALRLADLSASGANVVCSLPLDPQARVSFVLQLHKFADLLETDAEVVRVRPTPARGGKGWSVGIRFSFLDQGAQKILDYMMKWFASEKQRRHGE